jgi:hypothetical protein
MPTRWIALGTGHPGAATSAGMRTAEGLIGMGFTYPAFVVAKEAMLHADNGCGSSSPAYSNKNESPHRAGKIGEGCLQVDGMRLRMRSGVTPRTRGSSQTTRTSSSKHTIVCPVNYWLPICAGAKCGLTSAPRLPQALHTNLGSISDSLTSSGQWSADISNGCTCNQCDRSGCRWGHRCNASLRT